MPAIPPTQIPFDPSGVAASDSGIFGLHSTEQDARCVLVPVPWDPTTSYGSGTHMGPQAMLEASHQIDLFDLDTHKPYEAGICMQPISPNWKQRNSQAKHHVEQARNINLPQSERHAHLSAANEAGLALNNELYHNVRGLLGRGHIVGTVGGDHSSPLGAIMAHIEHYPEMGILHIDAHADLRESYEGLTYSHASIMHNVLQRTPLKALIQVGLRDLCEEEYRAITLSQGRIVAFFDRDLARAAALGTPWLQTVHAVIAALPQQVYVSFDIDGLDPTLCPSTGTPVPGGMSFREVVTLLAEVVASGRTLVGFDLNEVCPRPDGDAWDANVGARILYKLCGFALLSQK